MNLISKIENNKILAIIILGIVVLVIAIVISFTSGNGDSKEEKTTNNEKQELSTPQVKQENSAVIIKDNKLYENKVKEEVVRQNDDNSSFIANKYNMQFVDNNATTKPNPTQDLNKTDKPIVIQPNIQTNTMSNYEKEQKAQQVFERLTKEKAEIQKITDAKTTSILSALNGNTKKEVKSFDVAWGVKVKKENIQNTFAQNTFAQNNNNQNMNNENMNNGNMNNNNQTANNVNKEEKKKEIYIDPGSSIYGYLVTPLNSSYPEVKPVIKFYNAELKNCKLIGEIATRNHKNIIIQGTKLSCLKNGEAINQSVSAIALRVNELEPIFSDEYSRYVIPRIAWATLGALIDTVGQIQINQSQQQNTTSTMVSNTQSATTNILNSEIQKELSAYVPEAKVTPQTVVVIFY